MIAVKKKKKVNSIIITILSKDFITVQNIILAQNVLVSAKYQTFWKTTQNKDVAD